MYRFLAGILVATLLFGVAPTFAQSGTKTMSTADAAYVAQATKRLKILLDSYDANNGFIAQKLTVLDVTKAHAALTALRGEIKAQTPPIELLAVHTQFSFSVIQCENLTSFTENTKDMKKATAFDMGPLLMFRDSCANQIQASRLRLIDFAVPYGVNPLK